MRTIKHLTGVPADRVTNAFPQIPRPAAPAVETELLEEEMTASALSRPWAVILYNDEEHTIEEVVRQIAIAISCDVHTAFELTMQVHNEGRATIYEGSFERALHVQSILREIDLITEMKG
jgi:ATP-dependent Clp protease adaptor protein ClpS